ncbi:MAG: DUF2225 domain-containing protein [Promethearchaeota archaeon]
MTTWGPETVTCPNCEDVFVATQVFSCGFASKTRDFMPNYWGANPLPFFVHVCPNCMFAGYSGEFEVTDATSQKKEPEIPAWEKYYLLAQRLVDEQQDNVKSLSDIAWTYLQSAWTARVVDRDREKERMRLEDALIFFKRVYEKDTDARVTYTCGEINRLLGEFDEADRFFHEVPDHAKKTRLVEEEKNLDWLIELSKEQKTAASEGKTVVMKM